jgi:5'-nucleotidase
MKRATRVFAAMLSIGFVLMFTGTAAFAYGSGGAPVITGGTTTVGPGGQITCGGANFEPGETVQFEAHSTPVSLGSVQANAAGAWTATLTIPSNFPAGAHQIVATGLSSGQQAVFNFTVVGAAVGTSPGAVTATTPGAPLAFTGTDSILLVSVAAIALALGGFLVLGSRRRRQAHVA